MNLKYLFSGWDIEDKKGVDAIRYSLPLALGIKKEIIGFSELPTERRALLASLGSFNWPSDKEVHSRLGLSVAVACLLMTCKCVSQSSDELQAVSYFAIRELRKHAFDPAFFAYYDTLGLWIHENSEKVTDSKFPLEELVGGWVISNVLKRDLNTADCALSLLIGMRICNACYDLKAALLRELRVK